MEEEEEAAVPLPSPSPSPSTFSNDSLSTTNMSRVESQSPAERFPVGSGLSYMRPRRYTASFPAERIQVPPTLITQITTITTLTFPTPLPTSTTLSTSPPFPTTTTTTTTTLADATATQPPPATTTTTTTTTTLADTTPRKNGGHKRKRNKQQPQQYEEEEKEEKEEEEEEEKKKRRVGIWNEDSHLGLWHRMHKSLEMFNRTSLTRVHSAILDYSNFSRYWESEEFMHSSTPLALNISVALCLGTLFTVKFG